MKKLWLLVLTGLLAMSTLRVQAQQAAPRLLIPIGGGYSDIYAGFAQAVVARAVDGKAQIVVLPMPYATNALTITDAERSVNLRDAEERRYQIEEACKRAAGADVTCTASLAPVFVRADAEDPANVALFTPEVTAVFILGGDQTVAMQAIMDTPFEAALNEAYARGVIVAGTSAGGGLQASTMLGGYSLNFADSTSLNFGSVDVWQPPERRGLAFGLANAILDQHFMQRGRLGRLLSAISLPNVPHVGVGVDAYTGVMAPEGTRLENVFGLYGVTILDAETYHAAAGVGYRGPADSLSLRNVLLHQLAPGDSAYDLDTRRHSLADPAERLERQFEALTLPTGAGGLFLGGGLSDSLAEHPLAAQFLAAAGGAQAQLVIVASGYPSDSSAQRAADKYQAALGAQAVTIVVPQDGAEPVTLPEDITGMVLIGRDQSLIQADMLGALGDAWRAGKPLLADEAGAAVIGVAYSAHGPTPDEAEENEAATQKSLLLGFTTLKPGLGLLEITLEPRLLADNRWGRFFSLAYMQPQQVALGLNQGAGVVLTSDGMGVTNGSALTLDLRTARLALGANDGFVIANGLLDVFGEGDAVQPLAADVAAVLTAEATPARPTATPRPTQTAAVAVVVTTVEVVATVEATTTATAAPEATITPQATAAPSEGAPTTNSSGLLVLSGVVAVGVVLVSVWWRRRR